MSETTQPTNSGVFPDVQTSVRDRLASFSQFGGIALIRQYEGSIESRIDTALAVMTDNCRPGAAILIATPVADESTPNSPGISLNPFAVTVTCVEDICFNEGDQGTGRRALEWTILALQALKGWTPPGCRKPLTGFGKTLTLAPSRGTRVMWNLSLQTTIGLPLLRHPGEYGYTDTEPEPARI